MQIRNAYIDDAYIISELEKKCFLIDEALSLDIIKMLIEDHHEEIYILEDNDIIIGYLAGLRSNEEDFIDKMFYERNIHNSNGNNYFITGLAINPEYQGKNYSKLLFNEVLEKLKKDDIEKIILTCKEELINYYLNLGFIKDKISKSNFANKKWYQMIYKI